MTKEEQEFVEQAKRMTKEEQEIVAQQDQTNAEAILAQQKAEVDAIRDADTPTFQTCYAGDYITELATGERVQVRHPRGKGRVTLMDGRRLSNDEWAPIEDGDEG